MQVIPIAPEHREYLAQRLAHHWHTTTIRSRDFPYDAVSLPGFIAIVNGSPAGHLTMAHLAGEAEVVTLAADVEGRGIGTALLAAACDAARALGHARIFLTTSNDNLHALGFYQRRGWRIVAVHPGAIDRARIHTPALPIAAPNGIPSRDELELELRLR